MDSPLRGLTATDLPHHQVSKKMTRRTPAATTLLIGMVLMSAGCNNTEDAIVRDCVKAHMRAWDKKSEQRSWGMSGSREDAEAMAYRTCMKARSGAG